MNENVKTGALVGVALVAVIFALLTQFSGAASDTRVELNTPFFPEFTDELACQSMEITEWDADRAEPKVFRVAQVNGRWALPSKLDYPADAERQLAEAAGSLMDLKKLDLVSNERSKLVDFDVIDPIDATPGSQGVGKKVVLEDGGGRKLAEFIIGKEVTDRPGLRYVRIPKQDAVYITELDPAKLSTSFQDWIEPDLLKVQGFDITEVKYDNYSIDEVNRRIVEGDKLTLEFNDKDAKWTLDGLAETEELDTQKLNDMKFALDDLKIVDVRRKPAGLGRDLRLAEAMKIDEETFMSLASKGFIIANNNQLFSNEGEVVVRLKNGVFYVLRFGEIATDTEAAKSDEAAAGGGEGAPATTPKGQNRYLFVTADFDPEAVPKPQLETVPEPTAGPAATPGAETPPAPGEQPPADPAAAERARIEQDNKRKQDEYEQKLKDGEEQKKKLNDRFADWYYVISDDVYRKIKLNRADVVKPKAAAAAEGDEAPAADGGLDEFNQIKQEGLPAATP